jgi:hypothetical protein
MKNMFFASLALLVIAGCSEGPTTKGQNLEHANNVPNSETLTAVVIGFGGTGGRRGLTNVHLRSGTLTGVITYMRPEELDCRVGDRVPVKRAGNAIVALQGVCRKGAVLPFS